MNYKMIKYTLGLLMMFEAAFFLLPMITAICYGEWTTLLAFLISAAICLGLGGLCILKKPEKMAGQMNWIKRKEQQFVRHFVRPYEMVVIKPEFMPAKTGLKISWI